MTLYLYKTGTGVPVLTIEHVVSYTDNRAETEEGAVYGPFAPDCELSSLPDCSETLRADWKREHQEGGARLEMLEQKMSELEAAIKKGMML